MSTIVSLTPRDFALLAQEAYTAGCAGHRKRSRAIVRQTAAGLCLAFPRTDNIDCWGADFDILPMAVPAPVRCTGASGTLLPAVLTTIGNQPVTLVGHSLGAVIVIMAAVSLTLAGKPPAAVYGFEPPRVSPGIGVRALLRNVPVSLYKNGNDIVPDVPLGWNHAALITHIGKPERPFPNVQDHALARVLQALSL